MKGGELVMRWATEFPKQGARAISGEYCTA